MKKTHIGILFLALTMVVIGCSPTPPIKTAPTPAPAPTDAQGNPKAAPDISPGQDSPQGATSSPKKTSQVRKDSGKGYFPTDPPPEDK